MQKIAKMYDLVRNIYRKNYTNNNDRQNKIDFEEETQYTINCLHANLRENTKATDNVISALFLSCRYALYKTIESKLVNLVTDCDPDQGKILSDLLDDYSVVFSNLAGNSVKTQRWLCWEPPSPLKSVRMGKRTRFSCTRKNSGG